MTSIDWFRVDLAAGRTYQFDLEGALTGRDTLEDPRLNGILNADREYISNTTNDDISTANLNSRMTFTPTATGTYYVGAADASGSNTGTYTLSVRRILLAVDVPPGGLGPSEVPGAVRNVEVSYRRSIGQIVWWDAPDETQTRS